MEADLYYVVNAGLEVTTKFLRLVKESLPEDSEIKTPVHFTMVGATSLDEKELKLSSRNSIDPLVYASFNGDLDSVREAVESKFGDRILYRNVRGETQ